MQSLLRAVITVFSIQYLFARYFQSRQVSGWKITGVFLGVLLFFGIVSHADPATAQLFKTVESQVKTIFGSNRHYRQ
jgi:hypothetical protein